MSMRVAMLTLYPLDEQQIGGGIRMVSLNLVTALRSQNDLELHVIHCHGDTKVDRTVRQGQATLHYLATPRSHLVPNLTASVFRVRRLLRQLAPDVVHAHVGHLAYAAVKAGLPTIYTIHGVMAREREIYGAKLYDRLRYGLLDHYEQRALPRVARLVAISQHVREAYAQQRGDLICRVPWVQIDNPVPEAFFDIVDQSDASTILYAGSITEIKDLLMLFRAVKRVHAKLPQVRLHIAGRVTSAAYEQQLHAFVQEHDLEQQIVFLGLLDREALLSEYARASMVALSSLQENAPMAIIEGMAAAKPVVATAVGGIPDLVRDGKTGYLVPVGDDAAMADRMLQLLCDNNTRRSMGKHGRQIARQRFSADQIAQTYVDLYRRVSLEHKA